MILLYTKYKNFIKLIVVFITNENNADQAKKALTTANKV
jgi:hypothetical protein